MIAPLAHGVGLLTHAHKQKNVPVLGAREYCFSHTSSTSECVLRCSKRRATCARGSAGSSRPRSTCAGLVAREWRRMCAKTACASRSPQCCDLPPTTVSIYISLSTRNSVVYGPIWTIDRSNDSHVSCGFPEHSPPSSPDTVSTILKHQRNCKSILWLDAE